MRDPLFWLYSEDYRIYNMTVTRTVGSIHAAIFLSELACKSRYHQERGELLNDHRYGEGWFYWTYEDAEERTYLTRKNQDHCIQILESLGFIEKRAIGVPAKRYFRLNINEINACFFPPHENTPPQNTEKRPLNEFAARMSETDKQVCTPKTTPHNISSARMSVSDKLDCPKGTNLYKDNEQHRRTTKKTNTHPSLTVGIAAGAAVGVSDSFASIKPREERPRRSAPPSEKKPPPLPPKPTIPKRAPSPPPPAAEPDHHDETQAFGEEGLVRLTSKQYESLLKHMTPQEREEWIIDLDLEIAKRGPQAFAKRYKSHYHTILSWRRYRERSGGGGRREIVTAFSSGSRPTDRRLRSPYLTPGDFKEDNFKRDRV